MGYYKADNLSYFRELSKNDDPVKKLKETLSTTDKIFTEKIKKDVKDFMLIMKDYFIKEYNKLSMAEKIEVDKEMRVLYEDPKANIQDVIEFYYENLLGYSTVPWKMIKKEEGVPKIFHGREVAFEDLVIGAIFYNTSGTYIKTKSITTEDGKAINAIKIKGKENCGNPFFFKSCAKVTEINE